MDKTRLVGVLEKVAKEYPGNLVDGQIRDIPRIAFNISLVLETAKSKTPSELVICDLGGGIGLFSVGCAAFGFKRIVLADDFNDPVNLREGDRILELHRNYGVEVVSRDVVERGINDLGGDFDIVTTFDSMEHWHHSPKKLFRDVVAALKPDGGRVQADRVVDVVVLRIGHARVATVDTRGCLPR